jgi:hypothetical protein
LVILAPPVWTKAVVEVEVVAVDDEVEERDVVVVVEELARVLEETSVVELDVEDLEVLVDDRIDEELVVRDEIWAEDVPGPESVGQQLLKHLLTGAQ